MNKDAPLESEIYEAAFEIVQCQLPRMAELIDEAIREGAQPRMIYEQTIAAGVTEFLAGVFEMAAQHILNMMEDEKE